MAVLSAGDVRRFTPASYEGRDGAPVYLLKPMSWRVRGRFRAAMIGEGIRYPQDDELMKVAGELLEELAPDNLTELRGVLDAFAAQKAEKGPDKPADDAPAEEQDAFVAEVARRVETDRACDAIIDLLRQHPRLGRLLELRTLYNENVPGLAASYTLAGWENVAHRFVRRDGVVPDEVMDLIPRADLAEIGTEALLLIAVSESQRGN